ncbi:hypothetical protein COHCIP112018_02348 [Cohnella sp. JJ-181]|nr:hypothetical protein COHCIP112018_02348 [Cohnella sp. JJ-181]
MTEIGYFMVGLLVCVTHPFFDGTVVSDWNRML